LTFIGILMEETGCGATLNSSCTIISGASGEIDRQDDTMNIEIKRRCRQYVGLTIF